MKVAAAHGLRVSDVLAPPDEHEHPTSVEPAAERAAPQWVVWLILAAAGALRLYGATAWSLWDDEETAIYYALNSHKSFPSAFPLFFWTLGGLFQITGVSVEAARLMVALLGTLTLWLGYRCARYAGERVALVALVLMALSPGHLFWSQSIRYYVLLLAFQLVSIWCFLEGLETHRRRWFVLSAVAVLLGVSSHYSAALLVPVYAVVLFWLRERGLSARQHWLAVAVLGVVAVSALGFFSEEFGQVRHVLAGGRWRFEFPLELLQATAFYFGLPAVLLAGLALFKMPSSPAALFFKTLAVLVPMELVVIRYLRVMFYVLWYYGLVGLMGVTVLAAWGFLGVWRVSSRVVRVGLLTAALGMYAAYLGAYYGPAHGDRPRWKEATAYLAGQIGTDSSVWPAIYGGSPGVIAHYLGVPPAETMGHPLVRHPPRRADRSLVDSWYIVEARLIEPDEHPWLARHCRLQARFDSHMLVRDRSLLVFHCGPR